MECLVLGSMLHAFLWLEEELRLQQDVMAQPAQRCAPACARGQGGGVARYTPWSCRSLALAFI